MFDSYEFDREILNQESSEYGYMHTTSMQDIYDAYEEYKESLVY